MKKTVIKIGIALQVGLLAICMSCKTEQEFFLEGTPRNLEGSWRVAAAIRDGADLTPWVDFSQFRLQILSEDTYRIQNPLPFMVFADGTWFFDDPVFPSEISFVEEGGTGPVTSTFLFPIVNGKRMINLVFSPGCGRNKYEYTFERVTE